jgi:hypothetical protein
MATGMHSVANVKAALNAAGMNFKTISKATIMGGKQEPGVDSSKILGGFVYDKLRDRRLWLSPSQSPVTLPFLTQCREQSHRRERGCPAGASGLFAAETS